MSEGYGDYEETFGKGFGCLGKAIPKPDSI